MPDQMGPYRLLNRLDAGGMGTAWRAIDTRNEREVAVKIIHADLADDADAVERLQREEKFARIVRHPNIVQVLDSGIQEGRVFIAMELVDGESLKQKLARGGALPPAEALHVTWCVARALAEAHDVGVIHRDIKPGNILLDKQGNVKVSDFGIARSSEFSTLTMTGMFLGAPAYTAPEAIDGELDARSDLYSLGVTFYEMLFGRLPFEGGSPEALLRRHAMLKPDLRPLKTVAPPVAAIITRLLRRNPRERYQSAHALVDAIAAARVAPVPRASATPARTPAPPPPPSDDTVRVARRESSRRRWWIAAALGAGGIGIAGLVAVLMFMGGGEDNGTPTPTSVSGAIPPGEASPSPSTSAATATPPSSPPSDFPQSGIVSNTEPDICVNIRTEPSITADIVRCALRGERLAIVSPQFRFEEDLVWWNMRAEDGAAGWVAEQFLLLSTQTVSVDQELTFGAFTVTLLTVETTPDQKIAVLIRVRNDGPVTDFSAPIFNDAGLLIADANGTGVLSEGTANLVVGNALETGEAVTGWHRFDATTLSLTGPLTLRLDDQVAFTFTLPR